MKTKLLSLLGGAALLAGCVVDSEQPFYQATDSFFDDRLLGEWREPAKPGEATGDSFRIQRDGAQGYVVREHSDGKAQQIELRLFKLAGQLFLDFHERPADGTPVRHQLMKIEELGDTLKIRGLNYRWVRDQLRQHPEALAHRFDLAKDKENPPVTLTATTTQLQAFCTKHLAEAELFGEATVFERVKLQSSTPEPKP